MGQSTDQIRQEIDHNRDSAAQKIDQLQSQVQGTAEELRTGVQDTTDQVINQVRTTVEGTVESVRESMDVRQYIEQRPLLSLGVALVGGFILGGVTGGSSDQGNRGHQQPSYSPGPYSYSSGPYTAQHTSSGSGSQGGGMSSGVRAALQKTGLEETISNAAAALVGSLTDQLKTTLDQNLPGFADKMDTVRGKDGDFASKAKEAQSSSTL